MVPLQHSLIQTITKERILDANQNRRLLKQRSSSADRIYSKLAMYKNGNGKGNHGWPAKKIHKSETSCSYYMKIIFFFSSLIQSLIIVSLVLFLVYGQPQSSVEEKRVQELQLSFNKLTKENLALKAVQKNLTHQLNVTLILKKTTDKELGTVRNLLINSTENLIILQQKWTNCEMVRKTTVMNHVCPPVYCPNVRSSELARQQSDEMLKIVKANFSETMALMRLDLDNNRKESLGYHLETIELRRDKAYLEESFETYKKTCKEDFVRSLQGIPEVTQQFINRVEDLFAKHESFQLTCEKQANRLQDIRTNCSSLSKEVEDKLQTYLDTVGSQVTMIVAANAKCTSENKRLKEDATWCKGNHSAMTEENQKTLKGLKLQHDSKVEKLLINVQKLTVNDKLKAELLNVKDIEINILKENIKSLNGSLNNCKSLHKSPFGQMPSGSSTSFQWPNIGSTGTRGTGLGSAGSSPNFGSIGSSGSLAGRTTLNGVGSSGTGYGNVGSTGTGFGGVGSNGPAMTRTGIGGSSFSSAGSSSIVGSDTQFTARLTQHMQELQRYTKTN